MMLVSAAGVVMNATMAAILHGSVPCVLNISGGGHCHSHGGLSSGHGTHIGHGNVGEQGVGSFGAGGNRDRGATNINVRAAMVHVFGDLLQSIGVLISAYLIKNDPALKLADPICTFIFSTLVLATTVGIMRDACAILMEVSRLFFLSLDYFIRWYSTRNIHLWWSHTLLVCFMIFVQGY